MAIDSFFLDNVDLLRKTNKKIAHWGGSEKDIVRIFLKHLIEAMRTNMVARQLKNKIYKTKQLRLQRIS